MILPLVEEIGTLSKKHRMLIVTGGGLWVRIYVGDTRALSGEMIGTTI